MSDDIFSQTKGAGDDDAASRSVVADLVGEGKKFQTIEDLAKGKLEADQFIEQLQNENKLARQQLTELEEKKIKERSVSELVDAVKNANKTATEEGNQPISEESLSNMVREIMQGEHEAQTRATNRARAQKAVLDKVNGDVEAAKSYLAESAKALNMSVDDLQSLSETSPSAFLKLVDSAPSTGSQSASALHSGKNTMSMEGSAPQDVVDGHRTKHYYNKLKEQLGPAKYWNDTKIQYQYAQDAAALGDRFNQ